MAEFTTHSWDSFFGGLAFLWLAAVAWALRRRRGERWPWSWLAWFGLLYGVGRWLEMPNPGPLLQPAFQAVRLTVVVGSLAALFEFGRRATRLLGGQTWGNRVYAPLVGLAALGALVGSRLDPTALCIAAGLPAQITAATCAILAATVLWRHGRQSQSERSGLFRHWLVPAAAALLIALGWAGSAWRGSHAESQVQLALVGDTVATAQKTDQDVPVEVEVEVQLEKADGPAGRQSLAVRRLRSGLPLLLVSLGVAALLITMWAAAQRVSRW